MLQNNFIGSQKVREGAGKLLALIVRKLVRQNPTLVHGPNVQIAPWKLCQPCYYAGRGNGVDVSTDDMVLEVTLQTESLNFLSHHFDSAGCGDSARLACTLQSECANEVQDSFNHALCTDCSRSRFARRKAVIKVDMLDIRLTVLIWKHLNWINMKLEINCLPNLQTRNDSRVRLMLACVDNDDDDENYFYNSVNYHDNDRIRNTDQ